jgi:hypothetical protein
MHRGNPLVYSSNGSAGLLVAVDLFVQEFGQMTHAGRDAGLGQVIRDKLDGEPVFLVEP